MTFFFIFLSSSYPVFAVVSTAQVEISDSPAVVELISIDDGDSSGVKDFLVRVVDPNGVEDIGQASFRIFRLEDGVEEELDSFKDFVPLNSSSRSQASGVSAIYTSSFDMSSLPYGTYRVRVLVEGSDDSQAPVSRSQDFLFSESVSPTGFAAFSTESLKSPFVFLFDGFKRFFSWISQ